MLVLCSASILTVIACDMIGPFFYKRFFNQLAEWLQNSAKTTPREMEDTLIKIGAISFTTWFAWRTCMLAATKFESRTMRDIANTSFEYLQRHSHRFFNDSFAGALVKRVNRFSNSFETVADQLTLDMGQITIRIILLVGISFSVDTILGIVFISWTMVFVVFNVAFAKWKLKHDLVKATLDTRVTAQLSDTIANAVNLKLFAGLGREITKFRKITEEHHLARTKCWMLSWYSEGVQGLAVRGLDLAVLAIGVYYLKDKLTIGDFVMLRAYLGQLTESVRQVGNNIRKIYEAMADANEMTEILVKPHEIRDAPNAPALTVPKGIVEFRGITFSYEDGTRYVLRNFSLKTGAGERIGIVGPSGGGKSTILKVLDRLYDIDAGEILIDGQNIAHVTQDSLRQNIAYVPQDPTLFHRSLMENIRYSRPEATDQEVIEAAKLAHCHEFISLFLQGYDTLVGERGVKLSGGEKQRVAIARAILMNAPILVLDEATCSLDSESERYIQDSLSKLVVGRTVIAVAHRLATIQKMDRIVVVEGGKVEEEGDHDLLVVSKGRYQKLWDLQTSN
jgi:ATP-binding cassette, subfamily B, bacterial